MFGRISECGFLTIRPDTFAGPDRTVSFEVGHVFPAADVLFLVFLVLDGLLTLFSEEEDECEEKSEG